MNKILTTGKRQNNRKGSIIYLLNQSLELSPADLLDIFETHGIARKKLKVELSLFMEGECSVRRYREAGIDWWDYCGQTLINSYPTYFEKLPPLVAKINREKRNSKNYVLFLGSTDTESNQAPCLSLVQFQIDDGQLVLTAYQRSSDANLGLPADIYQLYLILDVLKVLAGHRYVYFTSNKSSIVELCDWLGKNKEIGNPFVGAKRKEFNASMNYNSHYTDIMLYNVV